MKPLTKQECLDNGGHCWVDSGTYTRNAIAGALAMGIDNCKHCPARRRKIENPKWKYEEL